MHYDFLFSDEMIGTKADESESNLNNQTNANENMFESDDFKTKLQEATDKVRAEFKEEINTLKSKILEYEKEMSTEQEVKVDNENE